MKDESVIVHSDILRDGGDPGIIIQDTVQEAGDNGSGSARAWTRPGDREDGGGNGIRGDDVERIQHDEDPEALDR